MRLAATVLLLALPALAGELVVTGRIVDSARRPISGALVGGSVRTDAEGRFRIAGIPGTGLTPLFVSHEIGVAVIDVGWLDFEDVEPRRRRSHHAAPVLGSRLGRIDVGSIPLRPAVPVMAWVQDANGPCAGAVVEVHARVAHHSGYGSPVRRPARGPILRATTDAEGRATWKLPAGDYEALAAAPGRGRGGAVFALKGDRTRISIRLPAAAPRAVQVLDDATGDPVAGATIEVLEVLHVSTSILQTPFYGMHRPPRPCLVTDEQGKATLRDLARGRWRLRVRSKEGAVAYPEVYGAEPIVVRLPAPPSPEPAAPVGPAALVVRVRDADGTPATGHVLVMVQKQHRTFASQGAAFLVEGGARIERLEKGGARVFVYEEVAPEDYRGMPAWAGTVELEAGVRELDVTLPPARDVVVTVTVDGEPRLPGSFRLAAGSSNPTRVVEEPAAGRIRFRTRVAAGVDTLGLTLSAEGFRHVEAVATLPRDGGPARVVLALTTAARK